MIQKLEVELPECPYHSPSTVQARKAAKAAVEAVDTRIDAFNGQAEALLRDDPAEIESRSLCAGDSQALHFSILQAELKARRLVSTFLEAHRRESQNVIQDDDAPREHRAVANESVVCESARMNANRLSALEARLRGIVERYLAV